MINLFQQVKNLLDELTGSPYMEYAECAWAYIEGSNDIVYYNLDSNLEDLYEGDGSTYSLEVRNSWEQDGCVFVNGDNGCGETITYVFKSNLEVNWDELEEMFNGDEEDD